MNNLKIHLSILFICCFFHIAFAKNDSIIIAFYNVENLFDCIDDSTKNDQDFTPQGKKSWTKSKYEKKLTNIFKTVTAIGEFDPPAVIGLCEVENSKVLKDLVAGTPLRSKNYAFVHHESNDPRGIDVAMLYRKDKFRILQEYAIPVIYQGSTTSKTRDILYVKGCIFQKDTIHIFINHFPSKLGGAAADAKRLFVAQLLKTKVDSIMIQNTHANILIMGDFNDGPLSESISKGLNIKCDTQNLAASDIINLMCPFAEKNEGSYKYKGEWNSIDQIMISKSLWNAENHIGIKNKKAYIFSNDFLLTEDKKNYGKMPFRTYNGYKYQGGFSDHLPIYTIIFKE